MMRSPRMGGERVLRAVSSAITTGKEPLSSASGQKTTRGGREGDLRTFRVPVPPAPAIADGAAALAEWEAVDREEDENGFDGRWVFGPVPSQEEVQAAVLSLQQLSISSTFSEQIDGYEEEFFWNGNVENRINYEQDILTESDSDWIEPSLHACNQVASSSRDHQKVLEAFHLLRVDPSIQKMVVSLSSDNAVWDAVMKNEAVQELKKSIDEGTNQGNNTNKNEGPFDSLGETLIHMFGNTKDKLTEFVKNLTNIVNQIFHRSESESDEKNDLFAETVRSALMLSVVVLLIVVVTRFQK